MMMNSIVAMLLGYFLDLMFGDMRKAFCPCNLMQKMVRILKKWLKDRYVDSKEGQTLAGSFYVAFMIIIFGGVALALVILAYKIHGIVGIIVEAILFWSVMSSKGVVEQGGLVSRALKTGRILVARRKLSFITQEDVSALKDEAIAKLTIKSIAMRTFETGVAPIFFMFVGGATGAVIYMAIYFCAKNLYNDDNKYFCVVARGLFDVFGYIPSRITAMIAVADTYLLGLNSHGATWIWRRDRRNIGINGGQTVSAYAGALDLEVVGDTYNSDGWNDKKHIGDPIKPCDYTDIYWAQQLSYGVVFISVVLLALVKYLMYLIF